ncbi:MAG: UDP-N-acetylmuramoyl-tripeptide--D-alanyl-D-alanine ligase [Thermodesulfobacteriota bacterium]
MAEPFWTVSQVLLATGGRFISGSTKVTFGAVSTDTRTLAPGDLFLALTGPRFDGAEFAREAVQRGAGGLIVAAPLEDEDIKVPVIQVADPERALGDLASYRRAAMADLKVVAITGSSGKTSVKEMCSAILGEEYNVLKTKGNFNNLIGMPLSLLPVDPNHDVAVLEMGMNRPGEIARMAEIADPDIACITNIQPAHLSGLHSVDGVAKAKGELFEGCKSWSILCVNFDDKRVRGLAREMHQDIIGFGRHRQAKVRATHVKNMGEEGMVFTLHIGSERVRLNLRAMGEHNVSNALAAAAISHAAGLEICQIVAGLEKCRPVEKRMEVVTVQGLKVVNDCYNANPASMLAAFDAVAAMAGKGKSIAILGDMLELGEVSEKAHRRLGESVACKGFDYLLVFGEYARIVAQGAMDASMRLHQVRRLPDKEAIVAELLGMVENEEIGAGDWLLVKGSRGMCMETIIEQLRKKL